MRLPPRHRPALASSVMLGTMLGGCLAACQLILGIDQDDGETRPADAAVDPSSASPGAVAPFCATVDASLCWSFDEDASAVVAPEGFNLLRTNGELFYSSDDPFSPPQVLDVLLDVNDAGLLAAVHHYQDDAGAHVTCDFVFRTDVVGEEPVTIAQLSNRDWPTLGQIVLTKDLAVFLERVQLGEPEQRPLGSVPVGAWKHVRLEVDAFGLQLSASLAGANGSIPLAVEGDRPLITDVHLGLGATTVPKQWRVSFDNLACTGFPLVP